MEQAHSEAGNIPVIELINVSKAYGDQEALRDINFKVFAGDVFGFLGPNGAGKTTAIKLITGLVHSSAGKILIDGIDNAKNITYALSQIGAIIESPTLYQYLSGRKNLELFANLSSQSVNQAHFDETIDFVGLAESQYRKVRTYSLGMKQRLGIALTLINNPKVIILDEPTNGLDPAGIKQIRELIKDLARKRQVTVFISSHQLVEIEQICNRICIINKGRIIAQGLIAELTGGSNKLEDYFLEVTGT